MNGNKLRISLAPMAGFTDAPFRRICGEFGADYAVSEMISAVALTMNDRKTGELAKITEGEPPVILQIFGHDPKIMAKAAEILLSGNYRGCSYAMPPAGIDINMGCPVKKIVNNGDGCALMLNPPLAAEITKAVKEVCVQYGVPLSVKFRSGWDSVTAPDFAKIIADAGADKITLHCRTREQMYAPSADPEIARLTAEALGDRLHDGSLTFTGNGDVDSVESANQYLERGCHEVAVGRAALGNPWIFRELHDPEHFTPPTLQEIKSLVIRFVGEVVAEKGEQRGVRESRSRAAYFIKGMRGSAALRDQLNRAETYQDFTRILYEWNPEE